MKFAYTAKSADGKIARGYVEASDARGAAGAMREQKLVPMRITVVKDFGLTGDILARFSRVSSNDVTNFTRQLATMITAGLPLTDALQLLKTQSSPAFAVVAGGLLLDVQAGVPLSGGMAKHPKVFSKMYVALMKAGEAAGVVETVLTRLADSLEKSREFRAKVVGAMIYPAIILVGMVGIGILMMVTVIPKITTLVASMGAALPLGTRLLIGISNFMVNFWWLLLVGVGGGVYIVRKILATPWGRRAWDGFTYKIPIAGKLLQQVMVTELARTLALLVSAGVSIVEALGIVAETAGNVVVESELRQVQKQVEKGFPLSVSMSEVSVFPPIVGQMVAVGEETGKLDEVLTKLSHYYEIESEEKVKGLTAAIEPIIIVVMAVGVGFLVWAVIMPIYNLTSQF